MWTEVLALLEQYQRQKAEGGRVAAIAYEKPGAITAEWDAEIEAEFQRVAGGAKASGRRQHRQRFIGAPVGFLMDVYRLTTGRVALVMALHIYRRTVVCKNHTVTLPATELAGLGVNRSVKRKALTQLQAAGLIKAKNKPGRATSITLTWQPS